MDLLAQVRLQFLSTLKYRILVNEHRGHYFLLFSFFFSNPYIPMPQWRCGEPNNNYQILYLTNFSLTKINYAYIF
jgi:hypothetical protein